MPATIPERAVDLPANGKHWGRDSICGKLIGFMICRVAFMPERGAGDALPRATTSTRRVRFTPAARAPAIDLAAPRGSSRPRPSRRTRPRCSVSVELRVLSNGSCCLRSLWSRVVYCSSHNQGDALLLVSSPQAQASRPAAFGGRRLLASNGHRYQLGFCTRHVSGGKRATLA